MRVVVGLGNPGVEYVNTRHSAGILLIDRLSETLNSDYGWRKNRGLLIFKTPKLVLVKTSNYFMNESGNMIRDLQFLDYKFEEFYLAHDDLDLKLGEFKIQKGVGPKVHNGVTSIEQTLGAKDFWRIRIGIDNRITNTVHRIPGEEYVLQKFSQEEREILDKTLDAIVETINPGEKAG